MTAPATAAEALRAGIARLADSGLSDSVGDARLLLAHALGLPRHRLTAALAAPMPADALRPALHRLGALLRARRADGETAGNLIDRTASDTLVSAYQGQQ